MSAIRIIVMMFAMLYAGHVAAQASIHDEYSKLCHEKFKVAKADQRVARHGWTTAPTRFERFFDAGQFPIENEPLKVYKNVNGHEMVALVSFSATEDTKKKVFGRRYQVLCFIRMMATDMMASDAKILFGLGTAGQAQEIDEGHATTTVWRNSQKELVALQIHPDPNSELSLVTALHYWEEE